MKLHDWTFQRLFARLFVYNILFEDSEVDERFLDIKEDSTVLGISGAGCRIAGHISQRPRRVDAVDINGHHLALTALKVAAAQRLRSYSTLYDLFGRGWHAQPEPIARSLVGRMPAWIQKHWKRNVGMFTQSMHQRGLASGLFGALRGLSGIDGDWLRRMIHMSVAERHRAVDEMITPVLRRSWVAAALRSPLYLVALGINFQQSERILETEGTDLLGFLVNHIKRVAATDLERNWFAWYAIAGYYNHDHPDAVPPYLRRDRHERSYDSPTVTEFHRRNIFDVLADARSNTWSHYTLCDAPDWMPTGMQRRLFDEVLRTSRDGGMLQYRSVETDSLIERLGLARHFQPLEEITAEATLLDRSRQYRRVSFYRIAH